MSSARQSIWLKISYKIAVFCISVACASSNVKRTSVKVSSQQCDLLLKINVYLNVREWVWSKPGRSWNFGRLTTLISTLKLKFRLLVTPPKLAELCYGSFCHSVCQQDNSRSRWDCRPNTVAVGKGYPSRSD